MLYLVGLKRNEGQDCIYEISGYRVEGVICANGHDWHPNVLGVYGAEIGSKIIDIIENLDFKSLTMKKKERILSIIDKHYQEGGIHSNLAQRGDTLIDEDDALGYWVFKIGEVEDALAGRLLFKETNTLC